MKKLTSFDSVYIDSRKQQYQIEIQVFLRDDM